MASESERVVLRSVHTLFGDGTTGGLTDPELLDRFLAKSDEAAFEALVVRHGPMVLDVCRGVLGDRHDAEDAFQATFLILARNARWIRKQESLASWLFGVARRVASRARADAARRRVRERRAATMTEARDEPGPERPDFTLLHEEVERMPRKYREPVVLCYLEGLTYEAAAHRLRCPLGTVSVRLKRAREQLRRRLIRRGVAVPAGWLAADVSARSAEAAIPGHLVESAVRAGVRVATGQALAGVVSETAVMLMETFMHTLRWKHVGAGVLGFSLLVAASAAGLAMRASDNDPDPPGARDAASNADRWVKTLPGGWVVELIGVSSYPSGPTTWWDPDGRPLAEAPYANAGAHPNPADNEQAREFAVRVRQAGEERVPPLTTPSAAEMRKHLERVDRLRKIEAQIDLIRRRVRRPDTDPEFTHLQRQKKQLEDEIATFRTTEKPTTPGSETSRQTPATDAEDRLAAEFRTDPRVAELRLELSRVEQRFNKARRATRNEADPLLQYLQRQKQALEQEIHDLRRLRSPAIRDRLTGDTAAPAARPDVEIGEAERTSRSDRRIDEIQRKLDRARGRALSPGGAAAEARELAQELDLLKAEMPLEKELKRLTAERQKAETQVVYLSQQLQKARSTAAAVELNQIQAQIAENRITARSAADQIEIINEQLELMQVARQIAELGAMQGPAASKGLAGEHAGNSDHQWQIVPSGSLAAGTPKDREGRVVPDVSMIGVTMPKDQATCTVRFGLASGPWKTEATSDPTGGSAHGSGVIFARAHESQGKTVVTTSHSELAEAARVVAVDRDGQEHRASRTAAMGARGVRQLDLEFDLPLVSVREFRFQVRSFAWAEFTDVALSPRGEAKREAPKR